MDNNGPLSRIIRSAQVQPIERPNGAFHGGPVLGDDPESQRLRHNRRRLPVDQFAPFSADPTTLAGSHAYLGIAFSHFGHAMAEMIHRIVPTRQIERDPHWLIVAQRGSDPSFNALPQVCRKVLALFGIDSSNVSVVTGDTLVEELLIVEQGSDLGGGPKDWYLDLMRAHRPALLPPDDAYPKKIYVSRTGLEPHSGILGERMLEATLAAAGFHILHVETLTLPEQIAHYANADVLIFAEGSACHGVEIFGRRELGHVILMNRRNRARSQFDPILAPRSTRFDAFTANPYLGSAIVNAEGIPLINRGVSALALHEFAAFLSDLGVATLGNISALAYLAAAHADLERYIDVALSEPSKTSIALVEEVRATLSAAIMAGGAIAPARPQIRARPQRAPLVSTMQPHDRPTPRQI